MRLHGAASLLLLATSGCSAFGTTAGIIPAQHALQSGTIAGSHSTAFVPHHKLSLGGSRTLAISSPPRGGAADTSPTTTTSTTSLSSATASSGSSTLPSTLEGVVTADNWSLLSQRGQAALRSLVEGDDGIGAQEHVYGDWPEAGVEDEGKIRLTEKVRFAERKGKGILA